MPDTSFAEPALNAAMRALAFARGLDNVAETLRIAARDLTGADGITFVPGARDSARALRIVHLPRTVPTPGCSLRPAVHSVA